MLKKFLKKKFSNKIFTWGRNLNNCGYEINDIHNGALPCQLQQLDLDIDKFVVGYSESFLLTKKGQLYQFGHSSILPKNQFQPNKVQTTDKVIDCDLGTSIGAVLYQNGNIQLYDKFISKNILNIENASKVCCGENFYLVVQRENNNDKVIMWSNDIYNKSLFIFGNKLPKTYLQYIDNVNQLIQQENSNIKKIQVVDNSIGMLLENGNFYTWGYNSTGNLGTKRTLCSGDEDLVVQQPKQPLSYIKNSDNVIDFALSQNTLVVLTDQQEAFWCGLDKNFYLEKIQTLNNKKVEKIGAFFNNFVIVDEDGRTFARESLPDEDYPIYWGNQKLYEYNKEYFGNSQVNQIGGKYENAMMIS